MPKKSSGSGASVEGFSIFTIFGNTEDEKTYMHLSTLPEYLDTVLIVLVCKCKRGTSLGLSDYSDTYIDNQILYTWIDYWKNNMQSL